MATKVSAGADALTAFDEELAADHLEGHWRLGRALTPEPAVRSRPHMWRWDMIHRHLIRAGETLGMEGGASRRTLRLCAPGLPIAATTPTFQTSVQLVKPGEVAEAHRHTMTAFRFVLQGSGGFTTVEGERFMMEPRDLILTPQWTWHDHGNDTAAPMIWIDGHDQPLIQALNACFFEPHKARAQGVTRAAGFHNARVGAMRPRGAAPVGGAPYIYKGREALAALDALSEADRDPYDGLTLDYVDPVTGGPTLATIACRLHRLEAGDRTRARRHTASTLYSVVEGRGESTIAGERFRWGPGDMFLVPNWAWHEHRAEAPAVLFSVRDDPVFRPFGLYRSEDAAAN